jgi:protochlorophyllide reductase
MTMRIFVFAFASMACASFGRRVAQKATHAPNEEAKQAQEMSGKEVLSTVLFKFMSNFNAPTLQRMRDRRKAADKFGDKKLVVVTGTSSGLGKATTRALLRTGKYHVIGAVRDLDKMEVVAEVENFPKDSFTPMHVELNSFASVHKFVKELKEFKAGKPIDRLICNAGVYQPSLPYAKWSEDGHEQTMQINYLSHFLMTSLLIEDLAAAPDPRCVFLGSVTGNDNTVGGGGVYPIADLKKLEGLKAGAKNPVSMFDGYNFLGAKAYKDSKLCNMMMANMLHDRYHKQTGVAFSSIYPGCIAETPLFREKRPWFRKYFPIFMKYITGGFVGEAEAGQRLFQVAHDPRCAKSGVYWSWNGGPREGRGDEALEKDGQILGGGGAGGGWDSIFENDQSDKVLDKDLANDLFKYSTKITGAEWPTAYQPKSPCPTLKVVGAVTQYMNAKEEAKRMTPDAGVVGGLGGKVLGATAKVTDVVAGNTIGRVAKVAQDSLLGDLPTNAVTGSFQELKEGGEPVKRKRQLLRKLLFWRKNKAADSPATSKDKDAELSQANDEPLIKAQDDQDEPANEASEDAAPVAELELLMQDDQNEPANEASEDAAPVAELDLLMQDGQKFHVPKYTPETQPVPQ